MPPLRARAFETDDVDAVLPPWTRSSCDSDDDRASHSSAPSDADDPCERPLRGRRSCPSTHAPDDADDAGRLREPRDDDADESASLPRARCADDA